MVQTIFVKATTLGNRTATFRTHHKAAYAGLVALTVGKLRQENRDRVVAETIRGEEEEPQRQDPKEARTPSLVYPAVWALSR